MIEEGSLFPSAIVGYRAWWCSGTDLRAVYAKDYWHPGRNEAACKDWARRAVGGEYDPHKEQAPAKECHCGLYSMHSPLADVRSGVGLTLHGAVVSWGKLAVHHSGLRAQYAQVVCLLRPFHLEVDRHTLAVIAARYDVPVVDSREGMEEVALQHGQRLPEEALPLMPDHKAELAKKLKAARDAQKLQQRQQVEEKYKHYRQQLQQYYSGTSAQIPRWNQNPWGT